MVVGLHRPTQLIVHRKAIAHNISTEIKRLEQNEVLFAVVKANGYGHGMIEVAHVAQEAGATGFCVAIIDEALALREAGFSEPILILGIVPVEDVLLLAEKNISVTISSLDWLKEAKTFLKKSENELKIHLGLDTGMGRIGFRNTTDLKAALAFLKKSSEFLFEGIFTHFATADEADTTYFEQQKNKFDELMSVIDERPRYVHVANTATSLFHKLCRGNMIRFGVGIYGMNPSGRALDLPYPLQPAMELKSKIVYVKELAPGDSVSYGATYTAKSAEWIATVPVGYADGFQRRMQGFKLLVNGEFCEIVGRVCMDQLMIRLPRKIAEGTEVVLIGKQGQNEIIVQDLADYAQTINYEITCLLTTRLARIYVD